MEAEPGTGQTRPARTSARLKEISELALAHLINDIYAPVLMALQPVLITTMGYSYFQAALLPVMHSLISSLLQPVFGRLADSRGFRVSVGLSILLSGLGIALVGQLTDHYLILLVCVAISGIGHATFHPGALCKVDAIASQGDRGRITSFFVVGGNLGQALGPILGGLVLTFGGIPAVTWLVIPAVVGALILLVSPIPDTCPVVRKVAMSDHENWRPVLLLFGGSTLRAWVTFGTMTFLPTYLVLNGYPILTATMLVSVMLLSGVAGQITGGILSDRLGRKPIVVVSTFAAIPAFALILLTHGVAQIAAIMTFGFLLWSSFSVTIAMAHEMIPSQIGMISGLFMGIAMGAGGLGVSVSGAVADHLGLTATLTLFPVIILIAAILFLLVRVPRKADTT
ncbi:MFS transporter [Methanosphaerula palustris]|uniref:Major facilitator superfamily MFS_1 n=1 Tax=Methanosphaerula palustris (strain ATCC BAA-1556 / DSM 19958 / E1-9c) TaxID=521011 RepID=B8GEL5_METPE|nr:MFS transporter [Methanosphaerula palustris]ACL17716.1 major facilitator superfamily MFS_1 [Methanosphaerula palustris E1-9c]